MTAFIQASWKAVISNACKLVGYPTSYFGLRCLLSDEMANVVVHLRKLVGTNHPLLKTARGLFMNEQYLSQTRGLVILLLSKCANSSSAVTQASDATHHQIMNNQRSLAEMSEIIGNASLIHYGITDLVKVRKMAAANIADIELGNKMATLCGDYLLAFACNGLAELRNPVVVESISGAIKNIVDAQFTDMAQVFSQASGPNGELSNSAIISLMKDFTEEDWCDFVYLSSGSLMSKACQASMLLAGENIEIQNAAKEFGHYWNYIYRLYEEIQALKSTENHSSPTLAHVLFNQLQDQVSSDNIMISINSNSNCKVCELYRRYLRKYCDKANSYLTLFPQCETRDALINLINVMCDI